LDSLTHGVGCVVDGSVDGSFTVFNGEGVLVKGVGDGGGGGAGGGGGGVEEGRDDVGGGGGGGVGVGVGSSNGNTLGIKKPFVVFNLYRRSSLFKQTVTVRKKRKKNYE
jgi:hypothetical protein